MKKLNGFQVERNRWGFWIGFENGIVLSVQFGWGNYCDNYNNEEIDHFNTSNGKVKDVVSGTAEMAVMYGDDFITNEFDDILNSDGSVAGHVGTDKFAELLPRLRDWKPNNKEKNETTKN